MKILKTNTPPPRILSMSKFFRAITCALMTILCCLSMVACGNDKKTDNQTDFGLNNEFVEVMNVSYGNSSGSKTINSQIKVEFDEDSELFFTEEQYEEEKKQIPHYPYRAIGYPQHCLYISRDKSNINDFPLNTEIILENVSFDYNQNRSIHVKTTVKTREIRMVSVQIIDNRSFLLKTYDGDISYITTDYYRVEYFK